MNTTLKRYDGMTVNHLRRMYQDLMSLMSQSLVLLRRSSRKALLYRTGKGENPYDFSDPQVQKTYLEFHQPKFM